MSTIVSPNESMQIEPIEVGSWLIGRHRVPDLRQLPDEEAKQWQRRLTILAADCGCTIGSLVAIAALGLYLVAAALNVGGLTANIWVGAGMFTLGAVVGKLLGLWRARRRLDQALSTLRHHIIELKLADTKFN